MYDCGRFPAIKEEVVQLGDRRAYEEKVEELVGHQKTGCQQDKEIFRVRESDPQGVIRLKAFRAKLGKAVATSYQSYTSACVFKLKGKLKCMA
ncbi:unnamed protein product [Toxocara canis]|uniref:Glutathione-S-transferase n=1 Tax=Toxocara canis TaxID=6265 RepID=A0A183UKW6_TOXCA|nr:unnamed protein product [Toxocara canis]